MGVNSKSSLVGSSFQQNCCPNLKEKDETKELVILKRAGIWWEYPGRCRWLNESLPLLSEGNSLSLMSVEGSFRFSHSVAAQAFQNTHKNGLKEGLFFYVLPFCRSSSRWNHHDTTGEIKREGNAFSFQRTPALFGSTRSLSRVAEELNGLLAISSTSHNTPQLKH